jgi:hypothetical protein
MSKIRHFRKQYSQGNMCPDTRAILPSPFRTHGLVSQPIDSLKMCIFFYYYVDAVPYGAWPHGGVELVLERIVLFYLGVSDVCMAACSHPKRGLQVPFIWRWCVD